jgi:hypothetical protein
MFHFLSGSGQIWNAKLRGFQDLKKRAPPTYLRPPPGPYLSCDLRLCPRMLVQRAMPRHWVVKHVRVGHCSWCQVQVNRTLDVSIRDAVTSHKYWDGFISFRMDIPHFPLSFFFRLFPWKKLRWTQPCGVVQFPESRMPVWYTHRRCYVYKDDLYPTGNSRLAQSRSDTLAEGCRSMCAPTGAWWQRAVSFSGRGCSGPSLAGAAIGIT